MELLLTSRRMEEVKYGFILEYGATFLPEVAAEEEWDINTTF